MNRAFAFKVGGALLALCVGVVALSAFLIRVVEAQQSPVANWQLYDPPPSNNAAALFGDGGRILMWDTTTGIVVQITNRCGQGNPSPCIRYVPVVE